MDDLIGPLKAALRPGAVLEGPDAPEKSHSALARPRGTPIAVLAPSSTREASTVLRLCHAAHQPVVPWSGKTGLVDGGAADGALALSLERMNRIEEIDALGATMTVEAGCVLQTVCEATDANRLFFPLDLVHEARPRSAATSRPTPAATGSSAMA